MMASDIPSPDSDARVHRLSVALIATISRVTEEQGTTAMEVELAISNVFTAMICTLGVRQGMSHDAIIAHAKDVVRLLPEEVRHKLARGPLPPN
jgi:hypothetical protein